MEIALGFSGSLSSVIYCSPNGFFSELVSTCFSLGSCELGTPWSACVGGAAIISSTDDIPAIRAHRAGVTEMSDIVECESSTASSPGTFYIIGLSSARGFHLPAFLRDEDQQPLLLERHCLLL